jgi:hypothetical protein
MLAPGVSRGTAFQRSENAFFSASNCRSMSFCALYRLPSHPANLVSANKIYSGRAIPSCSMDSNRVEFFRNARFNLPVGPLRCLAIIISARPSSSGSSGL